MRKQQEMGAACGWQQQEAMTPPRRPLGCRSRGSNACDSGTGMGHQDVAAEEPGAAAETPDVLFYSPSHLLPWTEGQEPRSSGNAGSDRSQGQSRESKEGRREGDGVSKTPRVSTQIPRTLPVTTEASIWSTKLFQ